VLWHAGCTGVSDTFQLTLDNDGRLVLSATWGSISSLDEALWWSDNWGDPGPGYALDLEMDGSDGLPAGPFWQS